MTGLPAGGALEPPGPEAPPPPWLEKPGHISVPWWAGLWVNSFREIRSRVLPLRGLPDRKELLGQHLLILISKILPLGSPSLRGSHPWGSVD